MTLGSLFDGIGGFPLAAQRVGINNQYVDEDKIIVESINLIRRLKPLAC